MEVDELASSTNLKETAHNGEGGVISDVENISKILKFAKLDEKSLKPCVQQVYFSESLMTDNFRLVELNKDTLDHINNGGKLVFKGNSTDNCVLCTGDKTYEVKEAEISNSLLLVDGLMTDPSDSGDGSLSIKQVSIGATSSSYLELKLVKPKLNIINDLLSLSKYDGPENEHKISEKKTWNDLISDVSASEKELTAALKELNVIELDGFIRIVDFDYLSRILSSIVALIEENSWHFEEFSKTETLRVLADLYPEPIIDHILSSYGCAKTPESPENWSLLEDKVSHFFAELLLRPTQIFNLREFLEAWRQSVPEGMITNLDQVKGLAFVDHNSEPAVIRYFPECALSEDVKTRFRQLFDVKDSWTIEELTPYVQPLCAGKMTVSVLVTKFARAFTKNGVKHYTSKYIS